MRTLDRILIIIAILIGIGVLYMAFVWFTAPVSSTASPEDSLFIYSDPLQTPVNSEYIPEIKHDGYRVLLNAKARYRLDGVLVSKRGYRGGIMNWLAPWDYGMIWGAVIEQQKFIQFRQVVRFMLYRYSPEAPVSMPYISSHSSNSHLIPANPNIRKALGKARKKATVRIEGYLVEVTVIKGPKLFSSWNSSLTRLDTGNGACEIIYVTRLRIGNKVYE